MDLSLVWVIVLTIIIVYLFMYGSFMIRVGRNVKEGYQRSLRPVAGPGSELRQYTDCKGRWRSIGKTLSPVTDCDGSPNRKLGMWNFGSTAVLTPSYDEYLYSDHSRNGSC